MSKSKWKALTSQFPSFLSAKDISQEVPCTSRTTDNAELSNTPYLTFLYMDTSDKIESIQKAQLKTNNNN